MYCKSLTPCFAAAREDLCHDSGQCCVPSYDLNICSLNYMHHLTTDKPRHSFPVANAGKRQRIANTTELLLIPVTVTLTDTSPRRAESCGNLTTRDVTTSNPGTLPTYSTGNGNVAPSELTAETDTALFAFKSTFVTNSMTRVRWSVDRFAVVVRVKGSRVFKGECNTKARFVELSFRSTGDGEGVGEGEVPCVVKLHVGPFAVWLAIVLLTMRQ